MAITTIRFEDTDDEQVHITLESDESLLDVSPGQAMACQVLMLLGVDAEAVSVEASAKEKSNG